MSKNHSRFVTLKHCLKVSVAIVMLTLAQASMAAKPWGPTFTHLAKGVNTTAVVEIETSAKTRDGYVKINIIETLLGETAPETVINLRIKNDNYGEFVKGEKKIVTFSYVRKHPTLRDEYIKDPKGPRILDVRGVTTLAAFDYSDDLKALFELQSDVHGLSSESEATKFLADNANLLVRQVSSSSDVRTQRLLIPEILLREDLFSVFTKKQTAKLMKSLASSARGNEIDSLFFDALMKIENTNDKKLAKLAIKKLEQFDTQINLASFEATMIVTALKATTGFGKERDVNLLSKFVDSNSPAIVKQTIRSMDSISPEKTHEVLAAVELSNNAHRDAKHAVALYLKK